MEKESPNSYDHFFRGAFAIVVMIFTFRQGKVMALLQNKKDIAFEGSVGLPGELVLPNEDTDLAMNKYMTKLLGVNNFYQKHLRTFSDVNRHPLGRIIAFAYYGLIPFEDLPEEIDQDVHWAPIDEIPELCADHNLIAEKVILRFRKGLLRHPLVFQILPEKFTISEIIAVYEQVFDERVDKPNFRRKVLGSGLVRPLEEREFKSGKTGRPAELFCLTQSLQSNSVDRVSFNFTSEEVSSLQTD